MIVTLAMPDARRSRIWVWGDARARTHGPDSAARTWRCEFAATEFRSALDGDARCAELPAKDESAGVKRTSSRYETTL